MTDFDAQEALLQERRKRYAQQLAGAQAPQGRMAGNTFVAPNPLEYLAAGLRGIGGMRGEAMAEKELGQLQGQRGEARQSAMANFLRQAQGTPAFELPADQAGPVQTAQAPDMGKAYAALMQAPDQQLQQAGMQGVVSNAQAQAKEQKDVADRQRVSSMLTSMTPQQAIAAGAPPELVKAFAEAPNLGRAKVARTVEIMGPNGVKQVTQLDDYGQPIGDSLSGYVAPVQVNQGGKITFATPQSGQSFDIGMSPSERDASARGWATVKQSQERLNFDKNKTAGVTGQKPLTESQAKGTLYLGQMRAATAELDKLGTVSPAATAATGTTWTNWAAPEKAQQVAQAQNQWAEAFLRAKTGAAATEPEVALNRRTFFPAVGDSAKVIKQKSAMRLQAERDMEAVAGPGSAGAGGGASGSWEAPSPVMPQGFKVVR